MLILGRDDDVINASGHRIGAGSIEAELLGLAAEVLEKPSRDYLPRVVS